MALLLALCLTSLVLCASYVPPAELAQEGAAVQPAEAVQPAREPAQEESVPAADEPATEPERPQNAADVYINGVLRGECLLFDGQSYMTMADFAALTGLESNGGTIGGLTPAISADGKWAEVNGRYLWLGAGVREQDGEQLWPLSVLGRMFSCPVSWDELSMSVDVDATALAPLASGGEYYNEEDLLWLSRIIYAESGNQPMEGQVAVGNVILNRVESPLFPDTVYDVIFDTRFGVQFSPAETGGIYCEPDDEAVIAAKLCLDGASVAGGSLYFVNPDIGADGWFKETKTFVAAIGDHDFYA